MGQPAAKTFHKVCGDGRAEAAPERRSARSPEALGLVTRSELSHSNESHAGLGLAAGGRRRPARVRSRPHPCWSPVANGRKAGRSSPMDAGEGALVWWVAKLAWAGCRRLRSLHNRKPSPPSPILGSNPTN